MDGEVRCARQPEKNISWHEHEPSRLVVTQTTFIVTDGGCMHVCRCSLMYITVDVESLCLEFKFLQLESQGLDTYIDRPNYTHEPEGQNSGCTS